MPFLFRQADNRFFESLYGHILNLDRFRRRRKLTALQLASFLLIGRGAFRVARGLPRPRPILIRI